MAKLGAKFGCQINLNTPIVIYSKSVFFPIIYKAGSDSCDMQLQVKMYSHILEGYINGSIVHEARCHALHIPTYFSGEYLCRRDEVIYRQMLLMKCRIFIYINPIPISLITLIVCETNFSCFKAF